MKKTTIAMILIGLAILAVDIVSITKEYKGSMLGSSTAPTLLKTATNTAVTVSSVSSTVLAKNTARQHAYIVNASATDAYLSFGGTATANKGVFLKASGGTYEINQMNLFIGQITAVASVSSVLTVLEE